MLVSGLRGGGQNREASPHQAAATAVAPPHRQHLQRQHPQRQILADLAARGPLGCLRTWQRPRNGSGTGGPGDESLLVLFVCANSEVHICALPSPVLGEGGDGGRLDK